MIRALRIRLILITMLLVSSVLAVTFTVQIISSQNRMQADSLLSLNIQYMRMTNQPPPGDSTVPTEINYSPNKRPFDGDTAFSTFFVTLSVSGDILAIDDFSRDLTDETAVEAAESAVSQSDPTGVVSSMSLRYKMYKNPDGTTSIGFIDISYEQNFIRQQVLTYTLIGFGSLAAFFLISLVLSSIAVRPVKKAWQQQQQFVADASHELKTPITVMLANTSILLSGKLENRSKEKKWIEYIDLEAKRMKKLVEDLLFLARSDTGKQEIIHDRVAMSDIVLKSTLLFEAVLYESGQMLETDIDDMVDVMGDQDQLRQLVDILMDNAAKHSLPDSTIKVKLSCENSKVVLSVNNASEPIPDEDLAHIFDRFFRIDKARTRSQSHYGLGLAIAGKIIESHHGKISVTSSDEDGTTFKVILPSVS